MREREDVRYENARGRGKGDNEEEKVIEIEKKTVSW